MNGFVDEWIGLEWMVGLVDWWIVVGDQMLVPGCWSLEEQTIQVSPRSTLGPDLGRLQFSYGFDFKF
ncbi:MAG TPA: hypothetical protein VLT36_24505 [Candidatus Dormibacteraeota bacterium]|nr:hypothetical protein [Candidatus Dormibacteraeota bacterium]